MLSIGRALMTNPKLLILDEATEGLSPNLRNEIWKVISEIKKEGISIILIDKYLHKIKALADYLYILSRGKNVWEGNSKDLNDNIVKKFLSTGNKNLLLTERGTMFGYNNLVSDMRSLPIMKKTGFPVIFDATHSVQLPGENKDSSGGDYEFVSVLAKAATTTGISALFIETHNNPRKAPSDGSSMVPLKELGKLIQSLILYDNLSKNEDLN